MIHQERIRPLNKKQPIKGNFVIYWMQQSQRAHYNHALEYAIRRADMLNLPVAVVFCIDENYPQANLRHFDFMIKGLARTGEKLYQRGIPLILRIGGFKDVIGEISREASLMVTDAGYTRFQREIRKDIAAILEMEFVQVESDVVVPVETASNKEEYGAYTIRPRINRLIDKFLIPSEQTNPRNKYYSVNIPSLPWDKPREVIDRLKIEKSVSPSAFFDSGTEEALDRLDSFIKYNLARYEKYSFDPNSNVTSGLSPYLHFGQISPLYTAMKVLDSGEPAAKAFLEQLIVRRELAVNFTYYNIKYDSYNSISEWCKNTLTEHMFDNKSYIYNINQLANAETHDPYWNAAQKEMVCTGHMHNYMRMYWGKKILEWSRDPEEAYQHALYLNDKYQLDGRDPNGYAGVAWCFGKHDRPWKERSIFGKVRYMNDRGLRRKFDADKYAEKVENLCRIAKQDFRILY